MKKIVTFLCFMIFTLGSCMTVCAEPTEEEETADKFIINVLGDSITEGYALDNPTDGYAYRLADKLDGVVINNYGLSGSAVCGNNVDRFIDRYKAMDKNADLILVLGGTNDYKGAGDRSTEIGRPGSTNILDFYGGYCRLVAGIKTEFPDSTLVLITPITRDEYQSPNMYGKSLSAYAHAIMLIGRAYRVPVIDLYHNPTVNFANYSQYLIDGLHPTTEGHDIMATEIANSLKAMNLGL